MCLVLITNEDLKYVHMSWKTFKVPWYMCCVCVLLSSIGNEQSCSHHGFPEREELEVSAASARWAIWNNYKSPDSKQNQWGKIKPYSSAVGTACYLWYVYCLTWNFHKRTWLPSKITCLSPRSHVKGRVTSMLLFTNVVILHFKVNIVKIPSCCCSQLS